MKGTLLSAFLLFCTCLLIGQKAALFTYDRDKVDIIMDQINESTSTSGSAFTPGSDPAGVSPVSDFGYFLAGLVPGCLVSAGGCVVGLLIGSEYTIAGAIAGSVVGVIIPVLAVSGKRKDPKHSLFTGIGGLVGITPNIILSVGIQYAFRGLSDYWYGLPPGCSN